MYTSEYLSLDALAAALGLPRSYLRRLTREGSIPALNVNGRPRFDEADVRTALTRLAQAVPAKPSPIASTAQAVPSQKRGVRTGGPRRG